MKYFWENRKILISAAIFLFVVFAIFGTSQVLYLRKAHSTFENYYVFRGCTQLLEKTEDYGICRTDNNQEIKIVKFQGKWYLDGDLPCGFLCF